MSDITINQAHEVITAALKKAEEIKTKMDIAVVDAGANLKAFIRMDDAWIGSIDIAIKKAKTTRFFNMAKDREKYRLKCYYLPYGGHILELSAN